MSTKNDGESHDLRKVSLHLQEYVEDILIDGEEVKLSLPADLDLKGYYNNDCALYITNQRIISFDPFHENNVYKIFLSDVDEAQVEEMYGNSIFKIISDGKIIELNRYTNAVSDLFKDLCQYINTKDKSELDDSGEEVLVKEGRHRCVKCGRVLRKSSAICPFCIDKKKVLSRLLAYAKPYWKLTIMGIMCSVLITAAGLVPPYLTKTLVDEVVLKKDLNFLWVIVGGLFFVDLGQAVFSGLRIYIMRYLSQHIVLDLQREVFAKVQTLSISYFDKRSTGGIMSRVSNDTQQLQGFIVQTTQEVLVQVLTLIGIGIIMFSMHWKLALFTLLPVPIVILISKVFAEKIHPIYHRIWRRRSRMNAILNDAISGVRVIKAFTGEEREIQRFGRQRSSLLKEQLRAARMSSFFTPAISFLIMMGGLIIWGLGGYWVITQPDKLTLGVLIAFIGYMGRFYGPVQYLAGMNDTIQQAATAAERVFEVLDSPGEPDAETGKILDDVKGEIEFRNVTFYYDKGNDVLKDINLKIRPGETIGLVGATGSGKSTIANILMRYYDPSEGQILVDGIDIADVNIRSLREHIGIVLQEPLLFRDTVFSNIAYSKPDATLEEIIEAAKVANAHDFISNLPDAYDTRLGERGVGLSGGERQRISISRAVIKDPDILILDEATSAVDTETEKLIQEAIERLIQNRTTIIIAHRLSTLRKADRIIVLEDGRIIEMGTHDELMDREGKFYRMIRMQADMGTDMLKVV